MAVLVLLIKVMFSINSVGVSIHKCMSTIQFRGNVENAHAPLSPFLLHGNCAVACGLDSLSKFHVTVKRISKREFENDS